jgi:hypothetical protein
MPTWDELFAYRQELEKHPAELKAQAKILKMQARFGKPPAGVQCRDCVHFFKVHLAKDYPKCELFGVTGGPGTDWRARFPGCGRFVREVKET